LDGLMPPGIASKNETQIIWVVSLVEFSVRQALEQVVDDTQVSLNGCEELEFEPCLVPHASECFDFFVSQAESCTR
jgi:hypothetical protein